MLFMGEGGGVNGVVGWWCGVGREGDGDANKNDSFLAAEFLRHVVQRAEGCERWGRRGRWCC